MRILLFSVVCMMMINCRMAIDRDAQEPDVVLAEVYDQKLTLAQIRPLLIDVASPEDSIAQLRTQVETWVREALLLNEAERNVPVDVNIDKLVQDYRSSLLMSNYENVLVKSLLDTVVTEAELKTYYVQNKNQYQLEAPIIRCKFIKLAKPLKEKELFQKLWRSDRPDDKTALAVYCQKYASDYLLQDSTWYRQPEIERFLPPGVLTKQTLYPGRAMRFTDTDYEYHLSITQKIAATEIAPLSYVSEQARRYILHKRKIDLLEKIKADIYAREINGVNIKIHI